MRFSSGPCQKPYPVPDQSLLGRSHRSPAGLDLIQRLLHQIRTHLDIPPSYSLGFVPGSATGAMETLLWNLLGPRPVDVITKSDIFASLWWHDVAHELAIPDSRELHKPIHDPARDLVFLHNYTSIGVCIPSFDFIHDDRVGLTICDATSSAFAMPIEWGKIDACGFSFQKGPGGEAGLGCIVLGPRAKERMEQYQPTWPIPRVLRLQHQGRLNEDIFRGYMVNTPSMMLLEDLERCLALCAGRDFSANAARAAHWIQNTPGFAYLDTDPDWALSPVAICFTVDGVTDYAAIRNHFEEQRIAYDFLGHTLVPTPHFRIWCGPTVSSADIDAFFVALVHYVAA